LYAPDSNPCLYERNHVQLEAFLKAAVRINFLVILTRYTFPVLGYCRFITVIKNCCPKNAFVRADCYLTYTDERKIGVVEKSFSTLHPLLLV